MERRTWEKLGIETSLLGFGCMRFPTNDEGKIDEVRSEALIDQAITNGVTYIDTAYPYHDGESEPFLGKVLKKYDRHSFTLATKLPLWDIKTREEAETLFHAQLDRLQVDYVDFYLLHSLDKGKWKKVKELGILEYLESMREAGKLRYIGFSFHDTYEVFEEILTDRNWDFCQMQLNYMDVDHQQGMRGYRLAEKLNIPVVIMEPNKGGMLARLPQDIASILKAVDPNASMASWSMRWIASLPNIKVVLSGMSDEQQVADNLKTFSPFHALTDYELETVAKVKQAIEERTKVGCTACGYCMPCSQGINIPKNFKVWNTYSMYENAEAAVHSAEALKKEHAFASACIRCGACEAMCPQHIDIRNQLAAAAACLEALAVKG